MRWFSRKPLATGTFRVTSVTRVDGVGRLVLNGMPRVRMHIAGIVQADGVPPVAMSVEQTFGMDAPPQVGEVVPAEITSRDPLTVRVQWGTPATQQKVAAVRGDADAQVVQQLMTTGLANHVAGETDAVGIAFTDPTASGTIAEQVAAALGTPISVDVDENGVKKHMTVGGGGHLSSAEAAELQRTGTPAEATIRAAARVDVPQAMLPGADASLWDLSLTVTRADGSTYEAQTRVGFRSDERRRRLGEVGLSIPVRVDPTDDSRVAVDSATYDAQHPDAPAR
ncbi:hypothetical protein [Subtercola sp. YIM 133946]|uniref:hypothetical protein n=1 Tax=Subtercola sp. YIM 133946 TaxID=3118909 RepID=UPI002F95D3EA